MTCPRGSTEERPRQIVVDSDLPVMDALEPWEREAVTPVVLDVLAEIEAAEDDDA